MKRLLASVAALALLSSPAVAANLTPDQLTQATTINNSNLLLIYPTGGPMQSVQWSVLKSLMQTALGTAYLQVGNNLSDLASPASARVNLGLGTAATLNTGTSGGVLGTLNGVNLYSAEQFFQASSTSSASVNLAPGVAPTSPINIRSRAGEHVQRADDWRRSAPGRNAELYPELGQLPDRAYPGG